MNIPSAWTPAVEACWLLAADFSRMSFVAPLAGSIIFAPSPGQTIPKIQNAPCLQPL